MENEYLTNEFGFEVVGFCGYCNREIYMGENYVVKDGSMYHPGCDEVRNRFYDPFEIGEDK